MLKKLILGKIRKTLTSNSKIENINLAIFDVNYLNGEFIVEVSNANGEKKKQVKKISEFSDLSEIIISNIKSKFDFKQLDKFILKIDFDNSRETCECFCVSNDGEKISFEIENLF